MQLLLVEDDATMRTTLQRSLGRRGFQVTALGDGLAALAEMAARPHDVVILDLTLPGLDGLQVLQQARARGIRTPVLVLTARGTVGDRVQGLNAGADDYLPKPFDLDELEARLRALVRRSADQQENRPTTPAQITLGALRFDKDSGSFYLNDEPMEVTPREQALLTVLMFRRTRPVSRQQLFEQVFSLNDDVSPESIELYIHRLRKKLQESNVRIVTLRGLGYVLELAHEMG